MGMTVQHRSKGNMLHTSTGAGKGLIAVSLDLTIGI